MGLAEKRPEDLGAGSTCLPDQPVDEEFPPPVAGCMDQLDKPGNEHRVENRGLSRAPLGVTILIEVHDDSNAKSSHPREFRDVRIEKRTAGTSPSERAVESSRLSQI